MLKINQQTPLISPSLRVGHDLTVTTGTHEILEYPDKVAETFCTQIKQSCLAACSQTLPANRYKGCNKKKQAFSFLGLHVLDLEQFKVSASLFFFCYTLYQAR